MFDETDKILIVSFYAVIYIAAMLSMYRDDER
jgi:hypothetical protein